MAFKGPGGDYELPVPKNFNEAMASPQAAQWWTAMTKAIVKFEAAGHFVMVPKTAVPKGTRVGAALGGPKCNVLL